ncbi:MAG: hypothetical protein GTO40_20325 [Deltaproteobacteria bacterium]|nr:hypothetical protein [Deltaproteobacteria bacterium]
MSFKPENLVSLAFVIFFAASIYLSRNWLLQASLFPWSIGIPGLVLALVQFWRDSTGWLQKDPSRGQGTQVDEVYERAVAPKVEMVRTLVFFGWMAGITVGVWLLGFANAICLFVFLYTKVEAREGWVFSLSMTAGTAGLLWGIFQYYLGMHWAPGALENWLTPV